MLVINRQVEAGWTPATFIRLRVILQYKTPLWYTCSWSLRSPYQNLKLSSVGQVVKTSPFHGGNTGSNPVRIIFIFLEDYPSPAEGNGLENRQAGKTVQGFESLILLWNILIIIAGWSSLVARRAHNPKVVGSNPATAIKTKNTVPWCRG